MATSKTPLSAQAAESLAAKLKAATASAPLSEHLRKQFEGLKAESTVPLPAMPFLQPQRVQKMPTAEEANHYQSAATLLRRLAESVGAWRQQLPEGFQPAVLALLNGGGRVQVERLAQESFHGIRIEGRMDDVLCVVLAHQATVQLLCLPEPVNPTRGRSIGFIIDGEASER
jgi:hypothetical protein